MNSFKSFVQNSVDLRQSIPRFLLGPRLFTWQQWDKLIQQSFERHFWVPSNESESAHIEHSHLIHRRGIYKDSFGASQQYADFQLRPNFPIAMAVVRKLHSRMAGWMSFMQYVFTLVRLRSCSIQNMLGVPWKKWNRFCLGSWEWLLLIHSMTMTLIYH